ncbi:MAG TPA: bifunctional diguanylate cyclase/phosphodiesterase [Acidimicrobiales bacterium]|nr:bifunctional diguanylate cyclase/phosphodiesterase [Acidimicrobiales bacterium]
MALSAALVALTIGCWVTAVAHLAPLATPFRMPLWVLVAGYALAELSIVHIEFRRDAHSVSINEIPLVLALVLSSPGHLILAHLVGAGLTLVVHRRQPPLKLVFNLSHFAFEDCVALLVFHALVHDAHPGPHLWLPVAAAVAAAATISVLTVSAVIWINQNRVVLTQLAAVIGVAFTSALFNTCLALVAVTVLWVDARGAVLLVVIGSVLCLAYRAYASLRQRHASLELLHEFTQAIRASGDAEQIVADVLRQARRMLRAETAELALLPGGRSAGIDWLTLDGDADAPVRSVEPALHPSLEAIVRNGRPVVGKRGTRDEVVRTHLAQRGHRDCILAPLLADGEPLGVLSVANRLGDISTFDQQDGRFFETIAVHTNVTLQNARLVDQLRHEALHDSLTGLANRVLFQQRLADLLGRRRPTDARIAVMLIDLDRFKEINDTLGHSTGDLLLEELAARLRRAVPEGVTVARLGGDEFALLDPSQFDTASAVALARALREELRRPFTYEDLRLEVSASIGLAVSPENGRDATTLLRRADVAMYAAKNTASGVTAYGDDLDEHSPRKLALVSELRGAIDAGELELHYQPKAALATGAVVGVEALVRWTHGSELVPPDEFIPFAERSGLIGPLTDFVLREALAQCHAWRASGHDLSVAVNLSARSLLDVDLADDIARALEEAQVEPAHLVLEITETSLMSDARHAMSVLNRLSDMGLTLAIDDFGTGYSSLSYLKRLPVDEVKIDKSFVLNIHGDDNDAVIVRSIVDLARNLGLRVVAEGVETMATWDALRAVGCDLAQGYVLSRPLPAERLTAWLGAAPALAALSR